MPPATAPIVHAALVTGLQWPVVFAEIGCVRHFRVEARFDVRAGRHRSLQLAERPAEVSLLLVGDVLCGQNDDRIPVDETLDLRKLRCRRERRACRRPKPRRQNPNAVPSCRMPCQPRWLFVSIISQSRVCKTDFSGIRMDRNPEESDSPKRARAQSTAMMYLADARHHRLDVFRLCPSFH